MEKEIWRDIEGYNGRYQVSNLGSVTSNYTGRRVYLKQSDNGLGYLTVTLSNKSKIKVQYVHRIVATAFIDNSDCLRQVNHINEIKSDNRAENLEWCTPSYNITFGTGKRRSIESKNRNRSWGAEKPVNQYDRKGNFIASFRSISHAGKITGVPTQNIHKCAHKHQRYSHAGGFVWRFNTSNQ